MSQVCSRFNDRLQRKKDALLPHILMKFPDSAFDNLPHFNDKMKVSVGKLMKTFSSNNGVAKSLAEMPMITNGDLHGSLLTLANTHDV